jgi:GNAT superfamily N-acetyltransferase
MHLPEGTRIRDHLVPGDMGLLIHLQSRYYFEEFGYGTEFEAYISKLFSDYIYRKDERERLWVVESEDVIVGSVGLFRENEKTARLRLLFLHPDVRGKGIGDQLVKLAEDFARKAGYDSLVLMTEDILKADGKIYIDSGFRLTGSKRTNMWGIDCKLQTYEKKITE